MIYEVKVTVKTEDGTCQIEGTGNAWFDLKILVEAVGACMGENRRRGKSRKEIEDIVNETLEKVRWEYDETGEPILKANFTKPEE